MSHERGAFVIGFRAIACAGAVLCLLLARALACLLLVASCDGAVRKSSDVAERAPPTPTPQAVHQPQELIRAATDIVGFLRGEVPFSRIWLADTVTLHLGIEEGRSQRAIARDVLRQPSRWAVPSQSLGMTYAFVPHPRLTVLTTSVGRHRNCAEYPLSSTFPDLAVLPHVGTTLKPQDFGSCLQTWNLTLVFDSAAIPPMLVAAVYDQWEW